MDLLVQLQELLAEHSVVLIIFVCTVFIFFAFFGDSAEQRKLKLYRKCKEELTEFINTKNCNPIFVRLAWHDSGTFDKDAGGFPDCGGANGSIRFNTELNHGANAGLQKAVNYLKKFHQTYGDVMSWADLIQMASACSIEHAGGPRIDMKYGRVSTETKRECPDEGNLPDAMGFAGSSDAAAHLRGVFHRMDFNDQEIVALSGAHTIGRAFKDRSGICPEKSARKGTQFTGGICVCRFDGHPGVGMTGGRSWTPDWLNFNNSYFKRGERDGDQDDSLLWAQSDQSLTDDGKFSTWFQKYAKDQDLFFEHYSAAHKKLSELGSKFEPAEGFRID